ncbi:MAG: ABC transporter permease [Alphaproteobacteria bacterium]|jgi:putative spermidine/putrescine transport system permease protein
MTARTTYASTAAAQIVGAVVLAFLVLPILAVVPASFNESSFIKIPPAGYSTRWYVALLGDAGWASSIISSVEIAAIATVLSVLIGTTAALGMERLPGRLRGVVTGFLLAPLIVPVIMISIALYYAMRRMGLHGSLLALALGHVLLCLPFVVLNVGVSLARLDPSLANAAAGLGASDWRIFRTVTLPAIRPGLAAGAAFAFVTSFDEVVISIFLSGVGTKTLPVKLWEQIRVEFTPVAAAGSAVILGVTIVAFLIVQVTVARSRRQG